MDRKAVVLEIGTLITSTTTSTTFRYYYLEGGSTGDWSGTLTPSTTTSTNFHNYYYLDGGIGDIGVWGIFNVSYKYPEWGKVPDHLLFAHQKYMKKRKYI